MSCMYHVINRLGYNSFGYPEVADNLPRSLGSVPTILLVSSQLSHFPEKPCISF